MLLCKRGSYEKFWIPFQLNYYRLLVKWLILMKEGINEETIINDILSEAIEENDDCELFKKVKQAESEFKKENQ